MAPAMDVTPRPALATRRSPGGARRRRIVQRFRQRRVPSQRSFPVCLRFARGHFTVGRGIAKTLSESRDEIQQDKLQWEDAAANAAAAFLRRLPPSPTTFGDSEVDKREDRAAAAASTLLQRIAAKHPRSASRHVRFDEADPVTHEVVPYSEVYGLHPSEFVFDRYFYMVPAGDRFGFTDIAAAVARREGLAEDEDDEWSSDDEAEY